MSEFGVLGEALGVSVDVRVVEVLERDLALRLDFALVYVGGGPARQNAGGGPVVGALRRLGAPALPEAEFRLRGHGLVLERLLLLLPFELLLFPHRAPCASLPTNIIIFFAILQGEPSPVYWSDCK